MKESFYALCAGKFTNYLLDVGVIAFFILMIIFCLKLGFNKCFFKILSTVASMFVALTCAKIILSVTGGLFGAQEKLAASFTETLSKLDGFNVDLSAGNVEAVLEKQDISAVMTSLALKLAGKEGLASGATLATLIGDTTAAVAMKLIVGFSIFLILQIALIVVKKMLAKSESGRNWFVSSVNALLGAAIGFIYAVLIVSTVFAVLAVVPNESVTPFMSDTLFVRVIYEYNPLIYLLGLLL